MPKRFRLTRRKPIAMTEDAYRRLTSFAKQAGLDEGEAISFVFENFDAITDGEALGQRLRQFNLELDARKA
ncbi:hypothetical protein [Cognatishimia sp.]|uniref:hypothetical protein n=1 Tax=Cognatishimia sp. TaxID=2211648 RepID=UPI00351272B4